ncbi:Polyhomeotic-like protein 3 [Dissostichus eleginoides]|uniref:Polyhomeotic-like protein 3 n=1 Tax=Dissostichus eleginoides TaxID=100907 RepID=A0AAD9BCX0_DISEL|nr:Polyhomeotic-like protein 3 [Dissostichus eleginoides]
METDGEQNQQGASTNGSTASARALQALQRQPNAAQYFQQLMLQQQINNAQLQNLAAVQQTTSTTAASVTSGSTTSSRPMGAPATSTISQSVLLSGGAGGPGQMYLRVNRSLRAPISSQLIFISQSNNDQVQNLAMRGVSGPKGIKTEAPERSDSAYSLVHPSHQSNSPSKPNQPHHQLPHIKIPTYPQPTNLKAHPSSSGASSSTSSIPLSQLLLHGTRTLTTGTTAPTASHTLVLTSSAPSQAHGYPVGTATIKPGVNAQTLVVQPLQKTSIGAEKSGHGNGPIPIQPKTLQGLRLPLQLPSRNPPPILPAPPPVNSSAQPPQPPHIPVQIVGARQSTMGNTQALTLARGSCCPDGASVLSSSSSLLTMVASIASREGGVVGRGVGLKTLQSPQEAPPLAQVSQAPIVSPPCSSLSLPLVMEDRRRTTSAAVTNGDASGSQKQQGKQLTGSLKRKLDSNSVNCEDGPSPPRLQPVRDHPSAVPTNPIEAGSGAPPASSSPSPLLTVSRGVLQGERAPPPQAVVKPNVLTHLIEGFVIQEGAEPFPVCGSVKGSPGEDSPDTNQSETVTTATVLKCEYCKNFAPASQFRGTKRFCSMSCAKRYNEGGIARRRVPRRTSSEIASAKIAGRPIPVKCRSESSHSDEESSGCEEHAPQFLSQEIDGQALLLLKEEHLMSTMNIKLGPALKICAHINTLRD